MADTKLTDLASATPALGDKRYFVDVSDTTDSAAGSSRQCTEQAWLNALSWRPLWQSYADVGSVGSTETDLDSYTIPANTLAANGQRLSAFWSINIASASAQPQIKVYFAGTARFDSGSISVTATGNWQVRVEVIRTGTTTARISVSLQTVGASTANYSAEVDMTSLDFTTTNVIKVSGKQNGLMPSNNDILFKFGGGELKAAA